MNNQRYSPELSFEALVPGDSGIWPFTLRIGLWGRDCS